MGSHMIHFERNQRPAKFWTLMGQMFASADIRRDLTTLHDEAQNDEWFLAMKGSEVISFACLRISGEAAELCHHWVHPDHRGKDLARSLTFDRIDRARDLKLACIHSVALATSAAEFERLGFSSGTVRGKYVRMEKTL